MALYFYWLSCLHISRSQKSSPWLLKWEKRYVFWNRIKIHFEKANFRDCSILLWYPENPRPGDALSCQWPFEFRDWHRLSNTKADWAPTLACPKIRCCILRGDKNDESSRKLRSINFAGMTLYLLPLVDYLCFPPDHILLCREEDPTGARRRK